MGSSLTVTAKGQVTLRKEILEHLGVRPGDRVDVDLLPGGQVRIRPKGAKPMSALFGRLSEPGTEPLSIDEIDRIAQDGWAGRA
ncbi:MAG: AbrB/MazE/SpoVT family DNA-binding domain-containing protein [Sneathiellaceae bacterium]